MWGSNPRSYGLAPWASALDHPAKLSYFKMLFALIQIVLSYISSEADYLLTPTAESPDLCESKYLVKENKLYYTTGSGIKAQFQPCRPSKIVWLKGDLIWKQLMQIKLETCFFPQRIYNISNIYIYIYTIWFEKNCSETKRNKILT